MIVFTASEKDYADPILDYLDPDKNLIQARFYRTSCYKHENSGLLVKDLRIFQRPLSDIAIVDNSVYAFAFQLENGIPIMNYFDDEGDEELYHLYNFLKQLAVCEDVRPKIRDSFNLVRESERYYTIMNEL